jgi:broad specificity phosphatase PhoE
VASTQTRWWWIRHAPVPDGGRIYGQSDLDCDCNDAEIFAILARELPRGAVWVTSNLARTKQTAAAILAAAPERFRDIEPIAVPELAEQHLGEWQGLERKPFYAARRIGTHAFWFAAADERAPGPDGESFVDLVERVVPAIERLDRKYEGRDIVAVTHGGTIRVALALALGVSPQTALSFFLENCSITRIDHLRPDGAPELWRVGAVNHRPWSRTPAAEHLGHNPAGLDKA